MSNNPHVLGIDFGTTNSSMAWLNPATGKAEILKNAEGHEKTPSLVYFGADETLVGASVEALLEDLKDYEESERQRELQRIVKSIKRSLLSPARIALPDGRDVRPVDVVAAVLSKLKRDAETLHFRAPVTRVVLTCPAVFSAPQRKKLEEAARQAGFTEVELLEEPVAAALAFARDAQQPGQSILVYDLGAGTFDLAVIVRGADGQYRLAVEPDGDAQCGGDDFDQALYEYWDKLAQRELGRGISRNGQSVDLLFLRDCRAKKESLTMLQQCTFSRLLAGGARLKHTMERGTFEGLIRERVEKTARQTAQMLRRAKEAGHPVESVVLIGGASSVPLVREMLKRTLPMEPRVWGQKDVAVALGAAYGNVGFIKEFYEEEDVEEDIYGYDDESNDMDEDEDDRDLVALAVAEVETRKKEKSAKDPSDWISCAESWMEKLKKRGEAERCLREAERRIEDSDSLDWFRCGIVWGKILNNWKEAQRCIQMAESCAENSIEWCSFLQWGLWESFGKEGDKRRYIQKAEACAEDSDDWCQCAHAWMEIFKNESEALRLFGNHCPTLQNMGVVF
jgi:molecular chaperone DnaK